MDRRRFLSTAAIVPAAGALLSRTTFAQQAAPPAAGDAQWIQLFNGKDLTGWTPKIKGYELGDNYADTYRVEDGVIKVGYDKYEGDFAGRYGHLFFEKPFSNYRLRLEYRIVGKQAQAGPGWALRNSGVMIHGQTPDTMLKDQDFPVSLEVQFLGGDGQRERTTGNLCTPGTNVIYQGKFHTEHCTSSTSKTFHGEQWVTAEVEIHGHGAVKHIINGETVIEYANPTLDPKDPHAKRLMEAGAPLELAGGTISLQSESHPIHFRKVELLQLPA
ncbi:MAG TPA: DUF1080 domain-containing protein [Lacipirellulaceae bacterium]|nr:DUF1080 domain-containing protein [Lacipirellulaceae bacterium]